MSLAAKLALNVSAVAAGRLLLVGTGVASVGASTRYLGVEYFGALAAATAFASLLGPMIDVGLSTIGAREISRHPERRNQLVGVILTVGLLMAVVVSAIALVVAQVIFRGGGEHELIRRGITLMLIPIPISAPVAAASAYLVSEQRAYMSMFASVAGSVVTLVALGLAIAFDAGFSAVMLAYALHMLGYGAVMVGVARKHVQFRLNFDLGLWKQMLRWSVPLGLASIVHGLYARIDLLLLSLMSTGSQIALYGLAYKLLDALYLLPYIVMATLLPELSRLANQPAALYELVRTTFSSVLAVVVPIVVYVVVFAQPIMELIGGKGFEGAGSVLQIMMLAVAGFFLTLVFAEVLIATNRQSAVLATWVTVLVVNVALNAVLIPLWEARGAAVALVISELMALGSVMVLYRRHGSLPRATRGIRMALAAVGMAGAALAVQSLPLPDVPRLVLGGVASLLVYAGGLVVLGALPDKVRAAVVERLFGRFAFSR